MGQQPIATATVRVQVDKQESVKELIKDISDVNKQLKGDNYIEYELKAKPGALKNLLAEIQKADLKIGTEVVITTKSQTIQKEINKLFGQLQNVPVKLSKEELNDVARELKSIEDNLSNGIGGANFEKRYLDLVKTLEDAGIKLKKDIKEYAETIQGVYKDYAPQNISTEFLKKEAKLSKEIADNEERATKQRRYRSEQNNTINVGEKVKTLKELFEKLESPVLSENAQDAKKASEEYSHLGATHKELVETFSKELALYKEMQKAYKNGSSINYTDSFGNSRTSTVSLEDIKNQRLRLAVLMNDIQQEGEDPFAALNKTQIKEIKPTFDKYSSGLKEIAEENQRVDETNKDVQKSIDQIVNEITEFAGRSNDIISALRDLRLGLIDVDSATQKIINNSQSVDKAEEKVESLVDKLEYLKKIKSESKFMETAEERRSDMEDKAWDAGGNNPKSEEDSQNKIRKYEELCDHIEKADAALDEFNETYEKVIITLKNGETIEIFDASDLDNLTLAKNRIQDIQFVLRELDEEISDTPFQNNNGASKMGDSSSQSADESADRINKEKKAADEAGKSFEKTSKAKDKFTEANKKAKKSADESAKSIDKEKKAADEASKSIGKEAETLEDIDKNVTKPFLDPKVDKEEWMWVTDKANEYIKDLKEIVKIQRSATNTGNVQYNITGSNGNKITLSQTTDGQWKKSSQQIVDTNEKNKAVEQYINKLYVDRKQIRKQELDIIHEINKAKAHGQDTDELEAKYTPTLENLKQQRERIGSIIRGSKGRYSDETKNAEYKEWEKQVRAEHKAEIEGLKEAAKIRSKSEEDRKRVSEQEKLDAQALVESRKQAAEFAKQEYEYNRDRKRFKDEDNERRAQEFITANNEATEKSYADQEEALRKIYKLKEQNAQIDLGVAQRSENEERIRQLEEQINNIIEERSKLYLDNTERAEKLKNIEEELTKSLNQSIRNNIITDIDKQSKSINTLVNGPKKFTKEYSETLTDLSNKITEISSKAPTMDTSKLVSEWNRVRDAVDKAIGQKGFKENQKAAQSSLEKLRKSIADIESKNTAMGKDFRTKFENLRLRIDTAQSNADVEELKASIIELETKLIDAGKAGKGFGSILKDRLVGLNAQFIATYFSIQDWIRYIIQAVDTVKELDTALTELRKVSDASEKRLTQNFQKSAETAKELGATITHVINQTADWSRLGYNIDDAEKLARISTLFTTVGDNMSSDDANSYLISSLQGFQMSADQAMEIVDKYNEVANNFAIDTRGIGEALQRSAASFNAAHTDLSKSIALVTASNTVVQNPESVGTLWKTMSARIRGAKSELVELGEEEDTIVESTAKLREMVKGMTHFDIMEDENTFKDIYEIVLGIGKEWKNLSDIEQASLGEALAGKRNANALYAVLNNIDTLEAVYEKAEQSAGSAEREQLNYAKSVQYSIDVFKASVQELTSDLLSSDTVKQIIDIGSAFVNILDKIIKKLDGVPSILMTIVGIINAKKGLGNPKMFGYTAEDIVPQDDSLVYLYAA